MAKEEVVLNVNVDAGATLKETKQLREQFAEAEDAVFALAGAGKQNTAEFRAAAKEAARLKQGVDNINESLDDLKPEATLGAFGRVATGAASGFAAAQGAAALLGDENEELEKTLVKVQAAMAFSEGLKGLSDLGKGFKVLKGVILANPLFMIVAAVTAIGAAMFALKDKIKVLGVAFDAIGDAIGWVIDKVKEFTDWVGISSFALDEAAEKELENINKVSEAMQSKYDREIALATAAGKNTVELEKLKQKAIIETAVLEARLMEQAFKRNGELTEEETERLDELLKIVADASLALEVMAVKETKTRSDEWEKQTQKHKEENDKRLEDEKAHLKEIDELYRTSFIEGQIIRIEEQDKIRIEQEAETLALLSEMNEEALEQDTFNFSETIKIRQRLSLENAMQLNDSLQNLSDTAFALRLSKVKAGSKEEEKIARRQFQVNKALQLSIATINGVQAIQSILAQYPKFDGGIAMTGALVAAGTASIANIAKIASTQFAAVGGGGGGTGGGEIPTVNAPRVAAPGQGSTQLNADGSIVQDVKETREDTRVFVTETDIRKTTESVGNIEVKATL